MATPMARFELAMNQLFAHTPRKGTNEWDCLAAHSKRVADMASKFVECFPKAIAQMLIPYANVIGLWHDLGKANPKFQEYLQACFRGEQHQKVPHAFWGAWLAYALANKNRGLLWKVLALPIRGHHTGLPKGGDLSQELEMLFSRAPEVGSAVHEFAKELSGVKELPPITLHDTELEALIRMLFSALVDADYLDTEKHFSPEKSKLRGIDPLLHAFLDAFAKSEAQTIAAAAQDSPLVLEMRARVNLGCRVAALQPRGLYQLTVPTGGGKTRSSMTFALLHACRAENGLRRIIFATPYMSITEQTAEQCRDFFGGDPSPVLEHHSQAKWTDAGGEEMVSIGSLAAENWDKPVIVTTTVQLLESLFSNQPSSTRKVHNISGSVIILDEIQTLPPALMKPTISMLNTLVSTFGCSVVLCSATMPALEQSPQLRSLVDSSIQEIMTDADEWFEAMSHRANYEMVATPLSWGEVVRRLDESGAPNAMVVVNTRKDALALLQLIESRENVFHLSTLLCGAHRREVLREVKERLKTGLPVRLVATQVVECGVDLSFATVWRAMGPLDRIVQAAGRCNRGGSQSEAGRVVIFEPLDGSLPPGAYTTATTETKNMLRTLAPARLHEPATHREYFKRLFSAVDLDKRHIQQSRCDLDYPKVAKDYRLIEETVPVVVEFGDSSIFLAEWRRRPSRASWRALQPFLVNLPAYRAESYEREGFLRPIGDRGGLMEWLGLYDTRLKGLQTEYEPALLIS